MTERLSTCPTCGQPLRALYTKDSATAVCAADPAHGIDPEYLRELLQLEVPRDESEVWR